MRIAEYLLQTLEANGVGLIFGNPGTTEIPLVRACRERAHLQYVVALSEVAAVPMADGHARASSSLGVVNLHVAPGLGNGMGALYTAGIAKTPMLVLVGGQDRRLLHTGPILHGPLEAMIRPLAKAVFSLSGPDDVCVHVRRAIRTALTPPTGPVALICPSDLLEMEIDAQPERIEVPTLGVLSAADVALYAGFLRSARSPAVIVGEDVHWAGASAALQSLAEAAGIPVYCGPYTAVLPIGMASPMYAGYLSPGYRGISQQLREHDALLFAGFRNFRTTLYSEAELPQRKAWIGHDPGILAAEGEFQPARVADLRQSLDAIREAGAEPAGGAALPPGGRWQRALELPVADPAVFHPTRAIAALLAAFRGALVFDEAGLSTSDVRRCVDALAGHYVINGSGGIGWGLAAAVGAAVGGGGREVVAIIGDGSALYASEALWTAMNREAPMLIVILSNRRYATLNEAARRLTGAPLDLFTLEPPVIDFSGLAGLYGLRFERCASEQALSAFLEGAVRPLQRTTLLELQFDPDVQPISAGRHF